MSQSKTKHCLLIEDLADDALLVRKQLSHRGEFDLQWVKDGEEAVNYLERKPPFADEPVPDVILLDLRLPRMDGFEFLEWRGGSTSHRQIPVMVLSCLTHPEQMRRSYDLGVKSYLTKPINWNRFGHELSRLASGSFAATAPVQASAGLDPRMARLTCTLIFKDGNRLTATASAPSADQVVKYQYAVDTSCLRPFAEIGTLAFLRWYMEGMAANLDAELVVRMGPGD